MRTRLALVAALVALAGLPALAAAAEPPSEKRTRAGVAVVDATWHVGASAGQFTEEGTSADADHVDPHAHTTKKRTSDGIGLRTSTRALLVEDTQGDRVAIVANDLYLPQDLLNRRVATLLAEHDRLVGLGLKKGTRTGITGDNLAVTASHNHNTPYYSTPGWGTWVFQDVLDLRFFEYMASRMAEAVIAANDQLRPVRMGGATTTFNEITSHTYGPKVGDDGTPAGQPYSHTTGQLSVVRLDDTTDRANPKPYANWVVFGIHPEYTWGDDLINGDITHAAARMVDRTRGTISVFSQRETGTSGPHKDTRVHEPAERREFQDMGFSQLDRAAKLLSDAIGATLDRIQAGTPERANAFAPMAEDFDVAVVSERFAPPATRPYPGVSNCNTASLFHGDPRLPVLGLPDCYRPHDRELKPVFEASPVKPSQLAAVTRPMYDQLKAAGVPVPESYSATALTGVEETAAVHLMAIKLGEVAATFCPCEQFTDTALNIETRLDKLTGNLWKGFDWAAQQTPAGRDWCVPEGSAWRCADPRNPAADLPPVDAATYQRFRAQINNDARGWEDDLRTLGSEAEPVAAKDIKGNFTHEEVASDKGYGLVLSVGMANDYWGYMPEYREYRSHDHYRKALSALGPHGADFLATRLSRMAASLNGGPAVPLKPLDVAYQVESARAQVVADGLGELARAYTAVYEKTLPADGGKPAITKQPAAVQRFGGTEMRFVAGSNYTDLPDVRVERLVDGAWQPYGDTHGDVQLMVDFPKPAEVPAWRAGQYAWTWTAAFEAFSSDVAQPDASGVDRASTPEGTYRFVARGHHRAAPAAAPTPYSLTSAPFAVTPWEGLTASDLRVEPDGTVSFAPGPVTTHTFKEGAYVVGPVDYPDRWSSTFRFLQRGKDRKLYTYGRSDRSQHQQYCPKCTFRPWADTGALTSAVVTVRQASGRLETVPATLDTATGRWRTAEALKPTEQAYVAPGGLRDEFGNRNGAASATVTRVPGGAPA